MARRESLDTLLDRASELLEVAEGAVAEIVAERDRLRAQCDALDAQLSGARRRIAELEKHAAPTQATVSLAAYQERTADLERETEARQAAQRGWDECLAKRVELIRRLDTMTAELDLARAAQQGRRHYP